MKVKLFTNKNQRLERKINKSTEAMAKDESEDHSEESEPECDISREILDHLSPAPKKCLMQRMSWNKSISSTATKVLRLDRAGKRQKYKKTDKRKKVKRVFVFRSEFSSCTWCKES